MATAITPTQMIELEKYQPHRELCTQWVKDIATYLRGLNNGDEAWAKKRVIAASVAHHPNNQDYSSWITQMTSSQKGAVIWDGSVEATVAFLNQNNGAKYDEMANLIYELRSQQVEF